MPANGLRKMVKKPKIIAHRGAWKKNDLPENSIASLRAAAEQKLWGTEFDVHLTIDNQLVINHDDEFKGIHIPTSTYEELSIVTQSNGEAVSTLSAFLEEGKKYNDLNLVLEVKTNPGGLARTMASMHRIFEMVGKYNLRERVQYLAFSFEVCLELRKLNPQAIIQYLNGDKPPKEIEQARLSGINYEQPVYKSSPHLITEAKNRGLITNVWTVDTEEDMRYFINAGVDFITTDEPELLSSLLTRKKDVNP